MKRIIHLGWEEAAEFDLTKSHGHHKCQQVENDAEEEDIWNVFAVGHEDFSGLFALFNSA